MTILTFSKCLRSWTLNCLLSEVGRLWPTVSGIEHLVLVILGYWQHCIGVYGLSYAISALICTIWPVSCR